MFRIETTDFANGETIPAQFTCEGANESPALSWSGEPAGTRSFALIFDDPDAPGKTWNHWLLWDIPQTVHKLPSGYRAEPPVSAGTTDFGRSTYGGPCPPKGNGPHRYYFRIYALDTEWLNLAPNAIRKELERALKGHILAVAEHMGRYERK